MKQKSTLEKLVELVSITKSFKKGIQNPIPFAGFALRDTLLERKIKIK